MCIHNPLSVKYFHRVSAGDVYECSLKLSIGIVSGESSVLTLTTKGSEINATLQIGGFEEACFSVQAPPDKFFSKLLNEIGPLKTFLPQSTRFTPLIDKLNNNPTLVNFLVGRSQPTPRPPNLPWQAACGCCPGFSPCCVICPLCDVFSIDLTDEVNRLFVE